MTLHTGCRYAVCRYAESRKKPIMLSVIILNVVAPFSAPRGTKKKCFSDCHQFFINFIFRAFFRVKAGQKLEENEEKEKSYYYFFHP